MLPDEHGKIVSPSRYTILTEEEELTDKAEAETEAVGEEGEIETAIQDDRNSKTIDASEERDTRPFLLRVSKYQHKRTSDSNIQNTRIIPSVSSKRIYKRNK